MGYSIQDHGSEARLLDGGRLLATFHGDPHTRGVARLDAEAVRDALLGVKVEAVDTSLLHPALVGLGRSLTPTQAAALRNGNGASNVRARLQEMGLLDTRGELSDLGVEVLRRLAAP